jgi:hypothetical protein
MSTDVRNPGLRADRPSTGVHAADSRPWVWLHGGCTHRQRSHAAEPSGRRASAPPVQVLDLQRGQLRPRTRRTMRGRGCAFPRYAPRDRTVRARWGDATQPTARSRVTRMPIPSGLRDPRTSRHDSVRCKRRLMARWVAWRLTATTIPAARQQAPSWTTLSGTGFRYEAGIARPAGSGSPLPGADDLETIQLQADDEAKECRVSLQADIAVASMVRARVPCGDRERRSPARRDARNRKEAGRTALPGQKPP